ncbi:MAG: ABC transporter permease [Pseudomonadota bacterium]
MTDISQTDQANEKVVVSPAKGNVFDIAIADIQDAVRLAPLWLRTGWFTIVQGYSRTVLGPLWHTLGLAAFVVVMGTIWGVILKQDPSTYYKYVTVSLMIWMLISSMITGGSGILINGHATALSMRFPYVAFAFGHVWQSLLLFAHHLILYVFVMVGTQSSPGFGVLLAIPALVLILANGVWMSMLCGMLCLRRRDLGPLAGSAMQVMMFVTPVFWPKDMLGPELAWATDLNPLFHFVQIIRQPLLGEPVAIESWYWAVASLIIGTIVTMALYGRYRRHMAYWY